jgi:superfamily I DNA and/or RNA helicase
MLVDEAAQAFELDLLLPWNSFVINHMILVGDPNQLPPTLKSTTLTENRLGLVMERLIKSGQIPFIQLNEQYRMHPHIARMSNELFYGGLVRDHESLWHRECELMTALQTGRSDGINFLSSRCIAINVNGKESGLYENVAEAFMIITILRFMERVLQIDIAKKVCVITFYNGQVKLIQKFMTICNLWCPVRTVDSFQGSENDYVILSYVRTNSTGFLKDRRRLNVAWTRAKHLHVNVGCIPNLNEIPQLREYFKALNDNNAVFGADAVEVNIRGKYSVSFTLFKISFLDLTCSFC